MMKYNHDDHDHDNHDEIKEQAIVDYLRIIMMIDQQCWFSIDEDGEYDHIDNHDEKIRGSYWVNLLSVLVLYLRIIMIMMMVKEDDQFWWSE